MIVSTQVSLLPFNTFGIDVRAAFFAEVNSVESFRALMQEPVYTTHEKLVIGGGSNILFTKNFEGLVIKNNIGGIEEKKLSDTEVLVKAGSGVPWHQLVLWTISNNYGGIENLSLIPGLTGAAPMQNIGAYGTEVKDVFYELESIDMQSGELVKFDLNACEFGYRESVFKNKFKNRYFIVSVTLRLANLQNQRTVYTLKTSYGDIQNTLAEMQADGTTIKQVSDAVIQIRQSKLPNPQELGNAGSFFKNPTIHRRQFEELILQYPLMPNYPLTNDKEEIKIPAGWLIEQCGWKGKVVGHTGSHKKQALVLVNYGKATGNEVWELALAIKKSVEEKFGIEINPEVNVY
jgi:UDP-N-acetylmuramate dehydrogenase